MKEKLLFITSANLATNPRLVKEIDALSSEYVVEVVLFKHIHWSTAMDEKMRNERKHIKFILLDVSKSNLFNWLLWAAVEKMCRILFPFFKNNLSIASAALSRKSVKVAWSLKKNNKYNLIIAHNLPSLFPVYKLSLEWNIPFAFDVEDYDPGMRFENAGNNYKEICVLLYKKILPKATYITSSSVLIGKHTLNLIGGHRNHVTIINSFPKNEFRLYSIENKRKTENEPLSFVWFSMTISFNRGLEEFFDALTQLNLPANVTLIGNLDPAFNDSILIPLMNKDSHLNISILSPVSQFDLHKELVNHDIGLALEKTNSELNRELCLTNKIIAYAQAGNYILASNTRSQSDFLQKNPWNGITCELSVNELLNTILHVFHNKQQIINERKVRFNKNIKFAWENQIPILKKLVTSAI